MRLPNFLHANQIVSLTPSQVFLALLMNYPENYIAYKGEIKKEYIEGTREIFLFNILEKLMETHGTINPVLLLNYLRKNHKDTAKVGAAYDYICELLNINICTEVWNIEIYKQVLIEDYFERQISNKLYEKGIEEGIKNLPDIIALQGMIKKETTIRTYDVNEAVGKHEEMQIDYMRYKHRKCLGVATGFEQIDNSTNGIMKNTLTVIGGDTGHGKTDLLMNIIRNMVVLKDDDFDVYLMLFNFEMIVANVMNRLMSIDSELNKGDVRKHAFSTGDEFMRYEHSKRRVQDANFHITEPEGTDAFKIQLAVERWKQKIKSNHTGKKEMFFIACVDYLQIVGVPKNVINQKRNYQIAEITRCLRQISLSDNTSVITLSQYNREYKKDGGKRLPDTFDLQDSSEIEKAADSVWLIHNPYQFGISAFEDGSSTKNRLMIVDAKNREGEKRLYKLFYDASCGKMKGERETYPSTEMPPPPRDFTEPKKNEDTDNLPF